MPEPRTVHSIIDNSHGSVSTGGMHVASRSEMVDSERHPLARRVTDLLRTPSESQRTILIDDEENIVRALHSGVRVESVCATESASVRVVNLLTALDSADIPVHRFSEAAMRRVFGAEKRSRVFALAPRPGRTTLSDLVGRAGDIVVLDGVRLAGNIGAIIRSSCALGAGAVVLVDSDLASPFDRRIIRASRGLVFSLPVILAERKESAEFLSWNRIPLVTLSADASAPLSQISTIRGRIAIAMGSERTGLSRELSSIGGRRLAIPMSPEVESFNVSVAAALALYERRSSVPDPDAFTVAG